jgi:hypothetical protein
MAKSYSKPDCKYYDWGSTAPRDYGAFCKPHGDKDLRNLTLTMCKNCKDYKKKI